MSKGPCLCGDPECPWCGMGAPHVEPPGGICDCCGKLIQEDDNDPYVCALCRAEIAKLVKDRGE